MELFDGVTGSGFGAILALSVGATHDGETPFISIETFYSWLIKLQPDADFPMGDFDQPTEEIVKTDEEAARVCRSNSSFFRKILINRDEKRDGAF